MSERPKWTPDQIDRFNNLVEKRPDEAHRVFFSRQVIANAGKHPPFMVQRHWRSLFKSGFLPQTDGKR